MHTANPPTSIVDFRGFYSSTVLILKKWNSQVHRGFPGNFESSNVSRCNVSRRIGRIASRLWFRCSLWRWGVTYVFKDVSHETPDVTPCHTSPPMPTFRTCLARNAWCNTMSHLSAAGSTDYTTLVIMLLVQPTLLFWKVYASHHLYIQSSFNAT